MYAGQRCSSWCLTLPSANVCSMPTARMSSVIAIAKPPSLNASTRPVTVTLPEADQQFYLTHKATLTIDYTWTSAGPDDMDVFAFAPDGTESGPGSPDDVSTGDGVEILNISNPQSGVWTIESYVGVSD